MCIVITHHLNLAPHDVQGWALSLIQCQTIHVTKSIVWPNSAGYHQQCMCSDNDAVQWRPGCPLIDALCHSHEVVAAMVVRYHLALPLTRRLMNQIIRTGWPEIEVRWASFHHCIQTLGCLCPCHCPVTSRTAAAGIQSAWTMAVVQESVLAEAVSPRLVHPI
jgi:hypothetical protein